MCKLFCRLRIRNLTSLDFMLRSFLRVCQFYTFRGQFQKKQVMVKVLNVAEKNDAAKNIADLLSRGTVRRVINF